MLNDLRIVSLADLPDRMANDEEVALLTEERALIQEIYEHCHQTQFVFLAENDIKSALTVCRSLCGSPDMEFRSVQQANSSLTLCFLIGTFLQFYQQKWGRLLPFFLLQKGFLICGALYLFLLCR